MKRLSAFALFLCLASAAFAQLTPEQKVADFMSLAGLYNRNYGPYEWKHDTFGFDLLNIKPWLDQVNASKDDLSFYDICVRYVASLQDSHDEFILPSDFEAYLPLTADIYDGKVLIDRIDRSLLPSRTYPFQVGDELVSVDGVAVSDWITKLTPYSVNGSANPVSRSRLAVGTMLDRYQGWYPLATQVGDSASVVIRRQNSNVETYTITWQILGTALRSEGPLPNPKASSAPLSANFSGGEGPKTRSIRRGRGASNPWGAWTGARAAIAPDPVPAYMAPMRKLQNMRRLHPAHALAGGLDPFDSPTPIFNPPTGFRLRLGARQSDVFLSGTFPVGTMNIGFIRIPDMDPANQTTALNQFLGEITFFQQNTNGLVIDVMGNGGGDLCYTQTLASLLIPTPFRALPLEIRATQNWISVFSGAVESATDSGAPQWVIDLYTAYLKDVQQAASENRGLTGPLPICGPTFENIPPPADSKGNVLAYTKPIVLLTDNFTLSAGESFTALLQDAKRATVYGVRTDGGGGDVEAFDTASYSEGLARVTLSLEIRAQPIQSPGYPTAPLIENIGVYPDVQADYMTMDNLLNGGQAFVAGFSSVISSLITQGHP